MMERIYTSTKNCYSVDDHCFIDVEKMEKSKSKSDEYLVKCKSGTIIHVFNVVEVWENPSKNEKLLGLL